MVSKTLRCIFTDIGNRTILDIIESRRKPSVVHWLSHLAGRERVQVVVIDMWAPYREAARAVFGPKVRVVVDKFHVTRYADGAPLPGLRRSAPRWSRPYRLSSRHPHCPLRVPCQTWRAMIRPVCQIA